MKIISIIKNNSVLLLILLLASVLRFYNADFQSLWVDEILTMNHTNPSLSIKETYDKVMFWEFIPHLFFYLCKGFFSVFGYSSLAGRVLSGIIGVLGVYAMYLLGKKLTNKNGGLIVAAFIAVNVFHISFSQEIRPYGLLFLFTVLSFYRLIIFFEQRSYKNALYYGLFTSLILHAHFFGFITLFAQVVLWIYIFYQVNKSDKKAFFLQSLFAALVIIIVFLPAIEPFLRVKTIDSFWLPKPTQTVYSEIFKSFLGNNEFLIYLSQIMLIIYFVYVFFKEEKKEEKPIYKNFTFYVLSIWVLISLIIPLIKSHLDVPMILSRYFINILPALLIAMSLGVLSMKNKNLQKFVIITYVTFSLVDLFVNQQFYQTVRKTQYRELTQKIIENNPNNHLVVTQWNWIVEYWFKTKPETKVIGHQLDHFVNELKSGSTAMESFWFLGANGQPFQISETTALFLNENFNLIHKFEYFDAWTHYYELKSDAKIPESLLKKDSFQNIVLDEYKNWVIFETSNYKTVEIDLKKGVYKLKIIGTSWPNIPIRNENAHLTVLQNKKPVADFYLSEKLEKAENTFEFELNTDEKVIFELSFDNDFSENGKDRNAIIQNISLFKNN